MFRVVSVLVLAVAAVAATGTSYYGSVRSSKDNKFTNITCAHRPCIMVTISMYISSYSE